MTRRDPLTICLIRTAFAISNRAHARHPRTVEAMRSALRQLVATREPSFGVDLRIAAARRRRELGCEP